MPRLIKPDGPADDADKPSAPAPQPPVDNTAALLAEQLADLRAQVAALTKAKPADVDATHPNDTPLAPIAAYTGKTYDAYRVMLRRDELSSVPLDVPKFEVPIIRACHGADKVSVSKEPVGKIQTISDNAAEEYQRLRRKYERRNEANPVVTVYGSDPSRLAEAMGLDYSPYDDDGDAGQLEASQQIDHSKA